MNSVPLLEALKSMASAIIGILPAAGLMGGLFLLLSAGRELALGDDRGKTNLGGIGVRILVGGALMNLGAMVSNLRDTSGGAGVELRTAMMASAPQAATSPVWSLAMSTALMWVACIGFCGIFRGFLLLNRAGSGESQGGQGDSFWAAFWHLLGGAVCVNIGLG